MEKQTGSPFVYIKSKPSPPVQKAIDRSMFATFRVGATRPKVAAMA
jgi:hypothetical protein